MNEPRPRINPIKALRLVWHCWRLRTRFDDGDPKLLAEAFIRAGIIGEEDRKQAEDHFCRERAAHALEAYGRALSGKS